MKTEIESLCSTCAILARLDALREVVRNLAGASIWPASAVNLDQVFADTAAAARFCRGDHQHRDPFVEDARL